MTVAQAPNPFRVVGAILCVILALMFIASFNGCTSVPEVKDSKKAFIIAGEARVSVIRTLIFLNDNQYIDPEDYPKIDAGIALTKIALEEWARALELGLDTSEAEKKFFESFEDLKEIRDPAYRRYSEPSRTPEA